jgi:hypothetical protein
MTYCEQWADVTESVKFSMFCPLIRDVLKFENTFIYVSSALVEYVYPCSFGSDRMKIEETYNGQTDR